jgi:DNA-nicking Smr family endonuclease
MIDEDDIDLFRNTVESQKPFDKDLKKSERPKLFEIHTNYGLVHEATYSGSDILSHKVSGVSEKVISQLKKGIGFDILTLDLHGLFLEKACQEMSTFLFENQNKKFLRIIHGKGFNSNNRMSIMKTQVVHFLKNHPQVLAFQSCPPSEGGTGAVNVYLR